MQKHLTQLRNLEKKNDLALGENPGDEQPVKLTEKVREKIEQRKLKREMKKKRKQGGGTVTGLDKQKDEKEPDRSSEKLRTEVTVVLSDKDIDESSEKSRTDVAVVISDEETSASKEIQEFKPYDYSEGAKKLMKGMDHIYRKHSEFLQGLECSYLYA